MLERRNNIRKQLRSEQLQRKFALNRRVLQDGQQGVFRELMNEISACRLQVSLNYNIKASLLDCAQKYDKQQNSYILIGNYLIDHPESLDYFEYFILSESRPLYNYLWCINLFLNIISENKQVYKDRKLINLLNEIMQNMKIIEYQNNIVKLHLCYLQFLSIVNNIIIYGLIQQIEQIRIFIEYSFEMIIKLSKINLTYQQIDNIFYFLKNIQNKQKIIQYQNISIIFTIALSHMVNIILRLRPHQRNSCLKLLQFTIMKQTVGFMKYIYSYQLIRELLYLLQGVPSLAYLILNLFRNILLQIGVDNLPIVLQMGMHRSLVAGMQEAMNQGDNNQLQLCLAGIFTLLTKLRELNEEKLLIRVKNQIEDINFHLIIEGLYQNQQIQPIENLVNIIVDQFYSEEVSV